MIRLRENLRLIATAAIAIAAVAFVAVSCIRPSHVETHRTYDVSQRVLDRKEVHASAIRVVQESGATLPSRHAELLCAEIEISLTQLFPPNAAEYFDRRSATHPFNRSAAEAHLKEYVEAKLIPESDASSLSDRDLFIRFAGAATKIAPSVSGVDLRHAALTKGTEFRMDTAVWPESSMQGQFSMFAEVGEGKHPSDPVEWREGWGGCTLFLPVTYNDGNTGRVALSFVWDQRVSRWRLLMMSVTSTGQWWPIPVV